MCDLAIFVGNNKIIGRDEEKSDDDFSSPQENVFTLLCLVLEMHAISETKASHPPSSLPQNTAFKRLKPWSELGGVSQTISIAVLVQL